MGSSPDKTHLAVHLGMSLEQYFQHFVRSAEGSLLGSMRSN
jgi:hypothetical protein